MPQRFPVTLSILALTLASAAQGGESILAKEIEDITTKEPVGPGAAGPRVVRAQILLDRAGFSPGEIDGRYGDDLGIAIRGYREVHNLKASGNIDAELWALLNADTRPALVSYTVTREDVKGPFDPIPKDMQEQARMSWMGFETPEEGLGENFLSSPRLLSGLKPGVSL
jgi:hypothetical protein